MQDLGGSPHDLQALGGFFPSAFSSVSSMRRLTAAFTLNSLFLSALNFFNKYMLKAVSICILAWVLSACASSTGLRQRDPHVHRVFHEEKSAVWEALQIVFKKYPKKDVQEETGLIETEALRGGLLWPPKPFKTSALQKTYTLKASLIYEEEESASHVSIQKNIQSQKDFFSAPQTYPSDLLEEETLMYRLHREIQIKKLIQKLYK